MDDKQTVLTDAEAAYADLRGSVAGLEEARMTERWLGTWGVREILIHVSGWHREMIPAIGRVSRGLSPYPDGVSYDDFDAWNARFVEAKRGAAIPEILAELEASHRDVMAAAGAAPAEALGPGGAARELFEGIGAQHYREHAAQIRDWRRERDL